jgi:hypothetical protein
MEYKLVEENDKFYLGKKINRLIRQGWRPLGGVSVIRAPIYGNYYTQAMVRGDDREQHQAVKEIDTRIYGVKNES